ncbi:MAG: hypothetical protein JOZ41_21475 [Chloroflexi bacterium]|nr:hypothetical protein [Chloroflexota bacterium]
MKTDVRPPARWKPDHLFLLGPDYHLGDLLWFTAVLAEYRKRVAPRRVFVGVPDRAISRILERNPLVDRLLYGDARAAVAQARCRPDGGLEVHDLRPLAVAGAMVRDWRYRLPWLYYRDLWLEPRGQWLATYLRLGPLQEFRPLLGLYDDDFDAARALPARYVALAPHVGQYSLPLASALWERLKGWPPENWAALAEALRRAGFEPVTLGAPGQVPIEGTTPMIGLPIRQAAGVIDRAAALISVESGLWFIAAARQTPFVIVPWWLPRSVNWPAPMRVPHRLVYRDAASVQAVLSHVCELVPHAAS